MNLATAFNQTSFKNALFTLFDNKKKKKCLFRSDCMSDNSENDNACRCHVMWAYTAFGRYSDITRSS